MVKNNNLMQIIDNHVNRREQQLIDRIEHFKKSRSFFSSEENIKKVVNRLSQFKSTFGGNFYIGNHYPTSFVDKMLDDLEWVKYQWEDHEAGWSPRGYYANLTYAGMRVFEDYMDLK
jgi:hypothetical protein